MYKKRTSFDICARWILDDIFTTCYTQYNVHTIIIGLMTTHQNEVNREGNPLVFRAF